MSGFGPSDGQLVGLLVNPTSGRGRGGRLAAEAHGLLREAGFRVSERIGRSPDEAAAQAHDLVADGVDLLAVIGGDGMIHLAIQSLAGTGVPLGVIPGGTGNDVARYFGIPRKDTRRAVDIIAGGKQTTIDLIREGNRYIITVLAAGIDAVINERANRIKLVQGQMKYNLATLAELSKLQPIRYILDVDGVSESFEAVNVAIANGPSFGGGLQIVPDADLADGMLDVAIIDPISRRTLIAAYPRLFKGTIADHFSYRRVQGKKITIAAPGVVAYADGERIGPLPLTVEVAPAALRVLVP